nr:hypothetical protein [Tanacetum cinerariifolium]
MQLMFDELLNGSSKFVSKSFAVPAADAPNQRQNHTTPLTNHTTPAPTCLINNTPFVNVTVFNRFVELSNSRGDAGNFGYFWDVGFCERYIGGSRFRHFCHNGCS